MSSDKDPEALRAEILALVAEYARLAHAPAPFAPGPRAVPVSGRVYGAEELVALVDASLEFNLTAGRYNDRLEKELTRFTGVRRALTANSGSSANLLAVSALTSPQLGDERLQPGDEVLTCATGFPTTINPILQNGLVPVFVDVSLPGYNADVAALEGAVGPRTRAIVLGHTLGNLFDVRAVVELARRHDLWLVEDTCDALGSRFGDEPAGSFGDLATLSFYPAHHITTGEGGAVLTSEPRLSRIVESLRDWGRDCWCALGKDNTCGKRFDWQLGQLPPGYDHKYIYTHAGYNLQMTDLQAAIGVAQMARLPAFGEARARNFARLRDGLAELADWFILPEPTPGSSPSWFGFPLTIRPGAPFARIDVIRHLESRGVATRQIFGGNLVRQPYMQGVRHRVHGSLERSHLVMNQSFWIGLYPGLDAEHIGYALDALRGFVGRGT